MELSPNLITALQQTSNDIAGDTGGASAEAVAELCVDASRMKMYGHPKAQEEASKLISEHGYSEFLKEAAKHVYC